MRFLLVEDEDDIALLVQRLLHANGYLVDIAADMRVAKQALASVSYSLVILDRRLPDGDGMDLIEYAKGKDIQSRFLVLSALGQVDDKISGLNRGGDDYITKPFEPDELVARIRAVLRRPLLESEKAWSCGVLEFYQNSQEVIVNGGTIALTRRELLVCEKLIKSAGRVVTRRALEDAVYGYDDYIMSNTLESHISRLRKTLAQNNAGVKIHAVRGVGYMMKENT